MASVSDFLRAIYDNSNARFDTPYEQWLPTGIAQNRERLLSFPGITDPANQMDAPVPDPLKGNMFQDAVGGLSVVALPFVAAAIGGALGVGAGAAGGLAEEAAALGVGPAVSGTQAAAAAGTGAAATGAGASTIGDMAEWGINQGGTNLTYNAATGAFEPAAGGTAAGGGGAGSGMVYDAATGTLVPASAATGTAAIAAGGDVGATAGATGGFFGNGSGPFGLTPMQTLGAALTIGSLIQGGAGLYGANLQANAAKDATAAQVGMFNTLNAQGAPYRAAGYSALGNIMSPESQAYFNKQFGPADLQAGLAPGYEFMRDQNLRAAKNIGNAQTGLISGNTMKGVLEASNAYALNAGYQPSFQNFETQRTGIFNRLSAIAGLGQTANAQSTQAGSAISPGIAQSTQNYGTALGGGFVGAGNALAGGLNNAASWYALPSILSGLKG